MSRIDTWISVLEAIDNVNHTLLRILLLPYYIVAHVCEELAWRWKRKKAERQEARDPRTAIREKLKRGELRLCDVPHQHVEGSNVFSFYPEHTRPGSQLYYVATEPDERIDRFFRDEREAVVSWSEWYGFDIEMVTDVDAFLAGMCFPQDKHYLKHGLMRNGGITTAEREYRQSVSPFTYFHLDADSDVPLQEQLSLIAQDVLSGAL